MAEADGEIWTLDGKVLIADVDLKSGFCVGSNEVREANARLIAAAPETAAERDQLLVALQTANDTNCQLRLRNDSLERMVNGHNI